MEFRIFLLITLFSRIAWAQTLVDAVVLGDLNEYSESAQEWLAQYEAIDINRADSALLVESGWISPYQAQNLVEFRKLHGEIQFAYELQQVSGFTQDDIIRLKQVLIFPQRANWNYGSKTYFLSRLEWNPTLSRGSVQKVFEGAPFRRQLRFRSVSSGRYSVGLNLESDKGEKLLNGANSFDFRSFHYFRENRSRGWSWVIGDFGYQIGEGLLFSTGFQSGKNPAYLSFIKKPDQGFRPHTGSLESGFFRGIGIRKTLARKLRWDFLMSMKKEDALVYFEGDAIWYQTLRTSGLHRLPSEMASRKTIDYNTIGSSLSWMGKKGQVGISGGLTATTIPLRSNDYNYENDGRKIRRRMSLYWNRRMGPMLVYSESAYSDNHNFALVAGTLLNMSANTYSSLVYRYYQPSYHTISGNAFGEFASGRNEQGTYLSISHEIPNTIKIAGYIDVFSRIKPAFEYPTLGRGTELMLILEKEIIEDGKITFRWSDKRADKKNESLPIGEIFQEQIRKIAIRWSQPLDDLFELRAQVQTSRFEFEDERNFGHLISLEMIGSFNSWSTSVRASQFSTDDFETRQYIYERDIGYSFSIPAFQGEGVRWYLVLKWDAWRNWTVWGRFAETIYLDREIIGSGWDQIMGNRKSEIKLQVRYSFNR